MKLNDLSPMPFGQYKGKPWQDVPASYFHWLWTSANLKDDQVSDAAAYIRQNLSALKLEYPNGIWK